MTLVPAAGGSTDIGVAVGYFTAFTRIKTGTSPTSGTSKVPVSSLSVSRTAASIAVYRCLRQAHRATFSGTSDRTGGPSVVYGRANPHLLRHGQRLKRLLRTINDVFRIRAHSSVFSRRPEIRDPRPHRRDQRLSLYRQLARYSRGREPGAGFGERERRGPKAHRSDRSKPGSLVHLRAAGRYSRQRGDSAFGYVRRGQIQVEPRWQRDPALPLWRSESQPSGVRADRVARDPGRTRHR